MHPHSFEKNPNQSCPKKMINKYTNTLDTLFSSKRHGVNPSMTNVFWGETQSLICSENCEMNNFLAILQLCAFYIWYKKVKFMAINFRSQTDVKYFMQTQLLRFFKDTAKVSSLPLLKITTKSTHFLHVKMKKPILWIELQTNKIQKVSKPYI